MKLKKIKRMENVDLRHLLWQQSLRNSANLAKLVDQKIDEQIKRLERLELARKNNHPI